MKRVATIAAAAALMLTSTFGASSALAAEGEGHTPIVVCHWVPAHGGNYVVITVDDDGAAGNANLQAHAGHANDVIAPDDGACGDGGDED